MQKGKVTDEIVHLDATQEEDKLIAQANTPLSKDGKLRPTRSSAGRSPAST